MFERYLQETENAGLSEDRAVAYKFLAYHCLQRDMLQLAYDYAKKCTMFTEVRIYFINLISA